MIDIPAATDRLFLDIAEGSGNDLFRQGILTLNAQLQPFRAYEPALIPDLAAEYEALSVCWAERDFARLQRLIAAYFERRQALAPQLVALINRPH